MEDDAVTLCLLSGLLGSMGHDVATATNGLDGMASLRRVPAEVVITDIIMPEQDGLATITQVRREYPDVKVIAISGGAEAMDMENAMRTAQMIGAHAVLPKPLDSGLLVKVLETLTEVHA